MRHLLFAGVGLLVCTAAHSKIDLATHPLTAPWEGIYGGVPPFDKIKVTDFEPVLDTAMAAQLAELEAIAANTATANFENTIVAMERTGAPLERAGAIFNIWSSTLKTPQFQKIEAAMAPKLAAFEDRITQNGPLFARIEAVYKSPQYATLSAEQQRLTWKHWSDFVRAGARLDAAKKAELSRLNQRLATLYTTFANNLLADEENYVTWLKQEQLDGLPQSVVAAAAAAAAEHKRAGAYAITNTRSSMEPFLTFANNRKLREQVWRTYYSRGDNGDKHDNNRAIEEILKLRAARAHLLGYPTHAHWRLEDSMARTPENAMQLMEAVWPAAIARVAQEVQDMQAIADRETVAGGERITIEPWDYRYYAEKVRAAKYHLDANEVKQYLQLENLRDGMFWVAGQLFDFAFTPVTGLPVPHPDVRIWRVDRKSTHQPVGLWYFDPYARVGKLSGAWMNEYRSQRRLDGEVLPIVSNNSNFIKGAADAPLLISWEDAETLFHEFGHALHGLNSNVTYPLLAGTNVARDYVEFPSQLLEHWLPTPEVLSHYARHVKTNQPMPAALVARLESAAKFNEGFATTEYLAAALVDMKLHLAGDATIDPDVFERETLAALHMPREIVMRHRTPQFAHIFSGDGYSAGYYSYLWADTLTADAAEAFAQSPGGFYDKDVARRLYENIFSTGNTLDQAEAFRRFRGRDVDTTALMRDRGFPVPREAGTAN